MRSGCGRLVGGDHPPTPLGKGGGKHVLAVGARVACCLGMKLAPAFTLTGEISGMAWRHR